VKSDLPDPQIMLMGICKYREYMHLEGRPYVTGVTQIPFTSVPRERMAFWKLVEIKGYPQIFIIKPMYYVMESTNC